MNTPNQPARGDVAHPYPPDVPPPSVSAESADTDPEADDLPDDAGGDEFEPL